MEALGKVDKLIEDLEEIRTEIIKVRPGEKYHESLISENEIRNSFETDMDYILYEHESQQYSTNNFEYEPSKLTDRYSSDKVELLSIDELKNILINENLISKL